jgi:hypothetical protein
LEFKARIILTVFKKYQALDEVLYLNLIMNLIPEPEVSYYGFVRSTDDAFIFVKACIAGHIRHITRRLTPDERNMPFRVAECSSISRANLESHAGLMVSYSIQDENAMEFCTFIEDYSALKEIIFVVTQTEKHRLPARRVELLFEKLRAAVEHRSMDRPLQ